MAISVQEGPLVARGYPYSLQIEAENPMFSAAHTYKAQVRAKPDATSVLAELTTGSGITFISTKALTLAIAANATASFPLGEVWLDIVRTDVTPNLYMGFQFSIPVILPVTRSA
jgi:hypothetical protein